MFHWINVDVTKHPRSSGGSLDHATLLEIEDAVFLAAVEQGVLVAKGSWFRAQRATDTELFFRTTFAAAPAEQIVDAIRRFGAAIRAEFGLEAEGEAVAESNGHAK
jgi:aromatic amino acid aminotransferase I